MATAKLKTAFFVFLAYGYYIASYIKAVFMAGPSASEESYASARVQCSSAGSRKLELSCPVSPTLNHAGVWAMIKDIKTCLRCMQYTKEVTLSEDDTLSVAVWFSKRFNIYFDIVFDVYINDETSKLTLRSHACDFLSACDICVQLVVGEDANGISGSTLVVTSALSDLRVFPMPFWDAKLEQLGKLVSDTLHEAFCESLDIEQHMRSFYANKLIPLVSIDNACATCMKGELEELVTYNVYGGKMKRAHLACMSYDILNREGAREYSDVIAMSAVLEVLQAFALIEDDIMDNSDSRRGKACWYRKVGTGIALNGGLLLLSTCYQLIERYVSADIRAAFRVHTDQVVHHTILGQHLDTTTERKIDAFTSDRYDTIVTYKTSFYTFFAPLLSAILASRCTAEREAVLLEEAKSVSLLLGKYFQCQDDMLDCYGEPSVTGKVGTDIRDGKCTWLAVYVMENGTALQKDCMRNHYGSEAEEHVIRALYEEIGIQQVWNKLEADLVQEIKQHLAERRCDYFYMIVMKVMAAMQCRKK